MKFAPVLALVTSVALLNVVAARGGEVKIEGVHICCGQCVSAAQKSLKGVDGVSDAKADKDSGSITLTAADDKAAAAAIAALAKAGFRGTAKYGDEPLEFPPSNAAKDAKADKITIAGVHLCCPACYKAAEKAARARRWRDGRHRGQEKQDAGSHRQKRGRERRAHRALQSRLPSLGEPIRQIQPMLADPDCRQTSRAE